MRTQFMVAIDNKADREKFYEYITNTYDLSIHYPYKKEEFINSNFPFVVDFKEKKFWICDSITCCAAAVTRKSIFIVDEFMKTTRM